MADELYNCAIVVKGLMDELTSLVEKTHLGPPLSIVTKCEVAIIAETFRHGQLGTNAHRQRHYLVLRGYAPLGTQPEIAEEKILKLPNLMIDILNLHVSLEGTATHSNVERGRLGYKTVAGVKCRTIDVRLWIDIAQSVSYTA